MGTFNRCVKNRLQILNHFENNEKMSGPQGGIFLTYTVGLLQRRCNFVLTIAASHVAHLWLDS